MTMRCRQAGGGGGGAPPPRWSNATPNGGFACLISNRQAIPEKPSLNGNSRIAVSPSRLLLIRTYRSLDSVGAGLW